MKVFELYSKRQKKIRGEVPEVYQYENIPIELRRQVVHILDDVFNRNEKDIYDTINKRLCREYGLFKLVEYSEDNRTSVLNFSSMKRNRKST